MSIRKFYNKTVDVHRLTAESGEGQGEAYELHLEDIKCHIQPLEEAFTEDLDGNFGMDFSMWCDPLNILEGDRIIDDDDTEYKVVGVRRLEFGSPNDHMELRIRISND